MQLLHKAKYEAAANQPCPGKVLDFSHQPPPGVTPMVTPAGSDASDSSSRQQTEDADRPWFLWLPAGAQQQQEPQQQQQVTVPVRTRKQQLVPQPPASARWVQELPGGLQPADAVWEDIQLYLAYYKDHYVELELFQVRRFEVDQQQKVCFWVQRPHLPQQQKLTGFDNREPETWYWARPDRFADYMEHVRKHRAAAAAAAAEAQASSAKNALQQCLEQAGNGGPSEHAAAQAPRPGAATAGHSRGAGAAIGAGQCAGASILGDGAKGTAAAGGGHSRSSGRQLRSAGSSAHAAAGENPSLRPAKQRKQLRMPRPQGTDQQQQQPPQVGTLQVGDEGAAALQAPATGAAAATPCAGQKRSQKFMVLEG
jgi:hypothetical protein